MASSKIGIATSLECPKAGYIRLEDKYGRSITCETTCKTWGCLGCRERVKSLIKMRISSGCSTLKQCYLITLTFRMGRGLQRDAASVQEAWTRLLRSLKYNPKNNRIAWLKIVEATKKGQPHLHLIVGNIGSRKPCCMKSANECMHPWTKEWMLRDCEVNCIEHEWAKLWFDCTGDSYVVDARHVLGANGAAAYLGKYLVKGMVHRNILEELGFARRWSKSRNWPAKEVMQLKGTADDIWIRQDFGWKGVAGSQIMARDAANRGFNVLGIRVGTAMAEEMSKKTTRRRALGQIKGLFNASNRAPDVTAHHSAEHRRGSGGIPTTG